MTSKALAKIETRLPMPQRMGDAELWQILCEVIFPHVKNPASIVLAVAYCKKRQLDILKRPVNIVPMWSSELKREVDTIWPSINETQITAARSGEWAGLDPPIYGDFIDQSFSGRRKDKDGWTDANVMVRYPEWCEITVYRLKHQQRYAFSERVYWLEAYGRSSGGTLPNGTWVKRPIGQLAKVAKAAALRAAFPEEETSPTDDEMHGGTIDDDVPEDTHRTPIAQVNTAPADDVPGEPALLEVGEAESWREWGARLIAAIRAEKTDLAAEAWLQLNARPLAVMEKAEPKIHANLMHSINKHRLTLTADEAEAVE